MPKGPSIIVQFAVRHFKHRKNDSSPLSYILDMLLDDSVEEPALKDNNVANVDHNNAAAAATSPTAPEKSRS